MTCELCAEPIAYCACERCLTCEQLFPVSVEMTTDEDGDNRCPSCVKP